ncbi:hypothetical protein [Xanthomonas hortorum]|uniref:hypothetical protein n=1 Tax=Xanthomonas hortorum TaxID=56454 RepID=UPI001E2866D8|nr:hypothetical protein [Xanthomonas hortorum]
MFGNTSNRATPAGCAGAANAAGAGCMAHHNATPALRTIKTTMSARTYMQWILRVADNRWRALDDSARAAGSQ